MGAGDWLEELPGVLAGGPALAFLARCREKYQSGAGPEHVPGFGPQWTEYDCIEVALYEPDAHEGAMPEVVLPVGCGSRCLGASSPYEPQACPPQVTPWCSSTGSRGSLCRTDLRPHFLPPSPRASSLRSSSSAHPRAVAHWNCRLGGAELMATHRVRPVDHGGARRRLLIDPYFAPTAVLTVVWVVASLVTRPWSPPSGAVDWLMLAISVVLQWTLCGIMVRAVAFVVRRVRARRGSALL